MYEFSPFGRDNVPRLIPSSGKSYDFRDEFKTALSSGDLTPDTSICEPGPGTRTVTDAESKLSIANGKLTFAGGKVSPQAGDPGFWTTSSITRTAGQILAFKVKPTDATKIIAIGVSNAKSGTVVGNGLIITGDTIKPLDGGTTGPTVFIPLDGIEYTLIAVLRSAGAQFFIKTSTGYFKIIWSYSTNNTATLYMAVTGNTLAGEVDFIRIPRTKWLPTPLLSDSFAAADATSNNGRTSDGLGHLETTGLGSGGSGVVWSGASGAIQSNRLVITPTLGSELLTNGDMETGSPPTGWTGYNATLSSGADAYGGAQSLNIVRTGTNSNAYQQITTSGTKWYIFSLWYKSPTNSLTLNLSTGYSSFTQQIGVATLSSAWTNKIYSARSALTNPYFCVNPYSTNSVNCLTDNISIKAITLSSCFATTTLTTTDIEITTKFQRTLGTQAGIVIGLNDAGTSFVLIYDDGAGYVKVDKCVAGTYTQLQNASMTYVADAELKVSRRTQADGSSEVWAWYNNTLVGTAAAVLSAGAENTALSGLRVGLFSTYEGNSFDSCMVYNIGTNNEYSILDRLIG